MCVLHVKDTALLLVNVRSINDNALQLIQFQVTYAAKLVTALGLFIIAGSLPDSTRSDTRVGVPMPIPILETRQLNVKYEAYEHIEGIRTAHVGGTASLHPA